MSESEATDRILEIGRRLYAKGFVAANAGNLSRRVGPDAVLCTPAGVSKGFMTPDMIVRTDMRGAVTGGNMKPSSELRMHLRVYAENADARAVVHAHPPAATAFAVAGVPLDRAILPEQVILLGTVPVTKYALTGSEEVADAVAPYARTHNAVLLANHGALTWGRTLTEALFRMEELEYYAQVTLNVYGPPGRANELSRRQIDALLAIRKRLGVTTGGIPRGGERETNTRDVTCAEAVTAPVAPPEEP